MPFCRHCFTFKVCKIFNIQSYEEVGCGVLLLFNIGMYLSNSHKTQNLHGFLGARNLIHSKTDPRASNQHSFTKQGYITYSVFSTQHNDDCKFTGYTLTES